MIFKQEHFPYRGASHDKANCLSTGKPLLYVILLSLPIAPFVGPQAKGQDDPVSPIVNKGLRIDGYDEMGRRIVHPRASSRRHVGNPEGWRSYFQPTPAPSSPELEIPSSFSSQRHQETEVPVPPRVGADVQITSTPFTENECTITTLPNGNIVVAWNDIVACPLLTGFGQSTDGGATFTDLGTAPIPPAGLNFGDPVVDHDSNGVTYLAMLGRIAAVCPPPPVPGAPPPPPLPFEILLATSTDGGATFLNPVRASPAGLMLDKPWLAVDRGYDDSTHGNVYVSWTNFTANILDPRNIEVARSTNGGVSFNPPVIVDFVTNCHGSSLAVNAPGTLYVAWFQTDFFGKPQVAIRWSNNGGVTFQPGLLVPIFVLINPIGQVMNCGTAAFPSFRPTITGAVRVNCFPHLAVDPRPDSGFVYLVWNDDPGADGGADDSDILFSRSVNGGKDWSPPIRLNDDATNNDQWDPFIAVGRNGEIVVAWYDRRNDPANFQFDVYMTTSTNGGVNFSANTRVTDQPSTVVVNNCYMGDYNQMSVDGSAFYFAWGDNRNGNPDVYFDQHPLSFPPQPIFVDASFGGQTEKGTATEPFRTASKGLRGAEANDEIRFRAGNYPEALTITKRVTLTSEGIAVIGR